MARLREPVGGWRSALALGAHTQLGALQRLARALAILAPEALPDALLERAGQARERRVVLVGPGEQHEAAARRRRPAPAGDRDAARGAVGGAAGYDRRGTRPEPRSDQQREQKAADGGERTGEGAARHALGDEPLGAPRGKPACVVLDQQGEEERPRSAAPLELERGREPPLEPGVPVDPERRARARWPAPAEGGRDPGGGEEASRAQAPRRGGEGPGRVEDAPG